MKDKANSHKLGGRFLLAPLAIVAVLGFGFYVNNLTVPFNPAGDAGNGKELLEARESLYNNIYVYGLDDHVFLTFGYNRHFYVESIYNTKDELDLPVTYTRFMTTGLIYAKKVESILIIGFGGGRTDWYLHRSLPDVPVTSVELDPAVVELAHKYFGIKDEPNFQVVNQDGRIFLVDSQKHYDIIIIDAYRGSFVPFHLLTKEFYQIVKDHLADGGVVVQNIAPSTMLFDYAVKTINAVFPRMDFYWGDGNVVTVAYDGQEKTQDDLAHMAGERQKAFHMRYDLGAMLKERRHTMLDGSTIDSNAKVLTDDFAPVESLKSIEQHNRKWPDQQPSK